MKRKRNFKFISVTTLILEVILFWIIFFIKGYVWVNGLDFVSDILHFILVVVMLIIIVSAILIIIKIIREFSKSDSMSRLKKNGLVFVVIVLVFLHSLAYYNFAGMEIKSSGVFSISNKQVIGDRYYLYTNFYGESDNVKIECPKDIYGELIVDNKVLYRFTYRWLICNDDKGVLEGSINTTNFIDNRQKLLN